MQLSITQRFFTNFSKQLAFIGRLPLLLRKGQFSHIKDQMIWQQCRGVNFLLDSLTKHMVLLQSQWFTLCFDELLFTNIFLLNYLDAQSLWTDRAKIFFLKWHTKRTLLLSKIVQYLRDLFINFFGTINGHKAITANLTIFPWQETLRLNRENQLPPRRRLQRSMTLCLQTKISKRIHIWGPSYFFHSFCIWPSWHSQLSLWCTSRSVHAFPH